MLTLCAWQGEVQLSDRAVRPSIRTDKLEEAEQYVLEALNAAPDVRVRIAHDNTADVVRTFEEWMELKAGLIKYGPKQLILNFDAETFASLERLGQRINASDHGETVLKSLRLLHLILKYQEEGADLAIRHPNGEVFRLEVRGGEGKQRPSH